MDTPKIDAKSLEQMKVEIDKIPPQTGLRAVKALEAVKGWLKSLEERSGR